MKSADHRDIRFGIDIGGLYVKAVAIDRRCRIQARFYRAHRGEPGAFLTQAMAKLGITGRASVSITGSAADLFADTIGTEPLDITRCQIKAVHRLLPQAKQIIDIGGSTSTLVRLDDKGRFQGYSTNSLCAAGTGSFLDDQAKRLGISFADLSFFNVESDPPNIATRCSVFAKSDLIHHQQEGYSKVAMWSGLCRGMTRTLLGTLLNGRPLTAPVSVIGGVARNAQVIYWLEMANPGLILVPTDAHLIAALGAAELAQPVSVEIIRPLTRHKKCGNRDSLQDWLLTLEKSNYPSFETEENFTDEAGTEIRLVNWPTRPQTITVMLGLDIGSTSTKAALVDGEGRVIVDLYRQTGGAPIEATQQLFRALQNLEKMRGMSFQIEGVGTTGSGRKMVGRVIGADAIINEISAHVAGAVATDPEIDTIFEIGGQDSKYMHLVNGHIRDSNMNYVCAAGTGSFVEAVSNKLGYPVATVGSAVLGRRPLATADRCTVFMEQDVERLIRAGCEPEDVLAGVMVSVVKNYLKQVVGNRPYNRERLFFQGATARNPALVAAFEHLLGVAVVVSPYCHVMGAYGVALLTRRSMAERSVIASRFRGLHLETHRIEILYETCTLCQNNCKIASAAIEGIDETPSWGYMCGRDPTEQQVRINFHDQPMRTRQRLWQQAGSGVPVPEYARVVGIPAALTNYSFLPLWRRFFNRLGYRIQLSGQSNAQVRELGTRLAGADFCFPAKVAVGHVAKLAEDEGVDFIFLPHMISDQPNTHTTAAKFCPYVQALPTYSATAMELNGLKTSHLLRPSVDMRQHTSRQVTQLHRHLAGPLAVNRRQVHAAWLEGLASQQHFTQACREEGQKILSRSREKGEKLLVLLGRSYNVHDPGLNLGLPSKLQDLGRQTLPMDFLDYNLADLGEQYCNTYWSYGQRILAACKRVVGDQALDAIYLTNFNCGPDSFLQTYAEEIFANKPLLCLELDEHGADAGYMTRIEAFFEVLRQPSQGNGRRAIVASEPLALKQRIIWIPCLHPVSTGLFAAAFHSFGFDARPLPPEDRQAFEIGRSLTRGSECLPTALTIGAFVKAVRDSGEPPHRHAEFMPTAEGPCRFGQYCTLHRQVLDRIGMAEVAVLSPSSSNSYQGLPEAARRYLWQAMLAGDLLHKAVCKVRPYEVNSGETNRVLTEEQAKLEQIAAVRGNLRQGLSAAVARLAAIERRPGRKPLVGIVGEIYVRCNTYANENVIDAIERFGGEAWLAPMTEWVLYTAATQHISFADRSHNPLAKWFAMLKNKYLFRQEHQMVTAADPFLADRHEPDIDLILDAGTTYLPINFEGEAILTIGRTITFAEQGVSMVVNCAPFGCMPGTLTAAIFRKLAPELGIPVVDLFYDGEGKQNERLRVFLNNAMQHGGDDRDTGRTVSGKGHSLTP